MVTNDIVVEDALRTYAAAAAVGTRYRDSILSAEHVRGDATSSRCAGGKARYAPKRGATLRARFQEGFCAAHSTRFFSGTGLGLLFRLVFFCYR